VLDLPDGYGRLISRTGDYYIGEWVAGRGILKI